MKQTIETEYDFDGDQKRLLLYLGHVRSPVTIDEMVSLSEMPTVQVLNAMEDLISRDLIHEKSKTGKGIYFIDNESMAAIIQTGYSDDERTATIEKLIEFYTETLKDPDETALTLAELYVEMKNGWQGANHIKRAADLLSKSGQSEKAVFYYDYLLERINVEKISSADCDLYLDAALGKIAAATHLMPISEQISILSKAESLAEQHKQWNRLSKIKLAMGQKLQALGKSRKALQYINDFWRLAEESGDSRMLKMATLLMSEYLHWKGKFSEVMHRYEEVVESLEEFGDDEATLKASARVGLCFVRCGKIARGMGMIEAVRVKAKMLNLEQVVVFTELMTMLSLFEIRRLPEAEKYVEKLLSRPEEVVGHYILAPAFISKAYLLCLKDRTKEALAYLKQYLDHVHFIGWPHQNGAWNFEFLDAMEKKGHVNPDFNYDEEVKRMLQWDDIYMKGVAYRYRALRRMEKHDSYAKVFSDLQHSEKLLKQAGAALELARTRIALGNLLIKRGETKKSQAYLEKAWSLFSIVDRRLFPQDLLQTMPREQKVEQMIDRIIYINESLGEVSDLHSFLERVVNIAMDFTMAMRGAFFVPDPDGNQQIMASRNLDPLMLKADQFELIKTIVSQTAARGKELMAPGLSGVDGIDDRSLSSAGVHSLVCLPVRLKATAHGYLYLDNRLGKKKFSENYLPYVRLLCSQIAVGLSMLKLYDDMKERKNRFEDETIFYKREMGLTNPSEMIVGSSDGMKRVIASIHQVAPTDSAVLVMGETGVGKELVAKAIHNLSERSNGPFIPVNLTVLPPDLVASELFGHEKGAFTGAREKNKGRFELAHKGTIFLDEIGDLHPTIQVKLLRVLQEGTFERLGSAKPVQSDFRVIAATNKDLYSEVEKGTFRRDLFYRLNVFPIHIPPLRARKGDIIPLAKHFIESFSKQIGKRINRLPRSEMSRLSEYHWPGNVRELKHLMERAVILYDGSEIRFSGFDTSAPQSPLQDNSPMIPLADFEKQYIERVLQAVCWKLSGPNSASSILKMKPTTLLYRMKKLGIKKPTIEA